MSSYKANEFIQKSKIWWKMDLTPFANELFIGKNIFPFFFWKGPSPPGPIEIDEENSGAFQITITWGPSPDAEFYRPSIRYPDGNVWSTGDVLATSPLEFTYSGLEQTTTYELIVEPGLEPFMTVTENQFGTAVTATYTTGTCSVHHCNRAIGFVGSFSGNTVNNLLLLLLLCCCLWTYILYCIWIVDQNSL